MMNVQYYVDKKELSGEVIISLAIIMFTWIL